MSRLQPAAVITLPLVIGASLVLAAYGPLEGAFEIASLAVYAVGLFFWLAALRHHLEHGETGVWTFLLFVTGVFGALAYWLSVDESRRE